MRYFVTGGAGFVGSHLTDVILRERSEVTVLDDVSGGCWGNLGDHDRRDGLTVFEGDVRDQGLVDGLIKRCDAVFHLAAVVGVEQVIKEPRRTMSVTVEGGANVLAACVRHRKPLLVTSTSEVYGDNSNQPLREDYDCRVGPADTPRWSYAAAKLIEEHMVLAEQRATGLPFVVARLFNTVGPRQTGRYGMVVPRFISAALDEMPIPIHGNGRQTRTFCDVRDVASMLSFLIGELGAAGKIINVGSDAEVSIVDLAKAVLGVVGGSSTLSFVNVCKARGADFRDIRRRVPSTTLLKSIVGDDWRVYPLDKTLEAVAEHVRHIDSEKTTRKSG